MKPLRFSQLLIIFPLLAALSACSSTGAMSLVDQLGGMGQVTKLAGGFVNNMVSNPTLSGLLANVDTSAATAKMSDQLCAGLGGDCTPPFTNDQIADAASKLSPEQKSAVSSSFSSALASVTTSPAVRDAVTKTLGSKMSGIVGSLL
jgi:hemoglobin